MSTMTTSSMSDASMQILTVTLDMGKQAQVKVLCLTLMIITIITIRCL